MANAETIYSAIRGGDRNTANAATAEQQQLAVAIRTAGEMRDASAAALAGALGLSRSSATLTRFAEVLGEPQTTAITAIRDRLRAATSDFAKIQTRNANLLAHLRSYFRDALADFTANDAPVRYGPSGSRLLPASGAAITARG
jgi:hypothetical protein